MKAGDTVWGIAVTYHVTIDSIVTLNDLDPKNPIIWEGQKLKVQPNYTATPTLTPTEPATATESPAPTATVAPSDTPAPSLTPSQTPLAAAQIGDAGGGKGSFPIAGVVFLSVGLLLSVAYRFVVKAASFRKA